MFLRPNHRSKDGKDHTYWSLVETVRTADGPRQKTVCYLGELNSSAQARWLRSVEVFNDQGEAQQLKLFPSHVEPPPDDSQVARILVNKVRLERTRQFGACYLGLQLWKRLELDRFFEQAVDDDPADVPWSRVTALLAINRLCAPGSGEDGDVCSSDLQLWKRLELDRFFEQAVDDDPADVPWSRVTALLAINRLCAPGSELAIEERWY